MDGSKKGDGTKRPETGRRLGQGLGQGPEQRRAGSTEENGPKHTERAERGYSRPPLARMVRLHELLVGERYPNCRKIAEEFEVSAKTVQRDVNFMRDQMGLPVEYDKKRFGFHYTRMVSGFPAIGISPEKGQHPNPWRKSPPAPFGERPPLPAQGGFGEPVRIRFDAESAMAVRSRTWHATQIILSLPSGGVDMTLRARDEWEIARWVLSWGAHAWVIEPARLRSRVRDMAREILERHQ